jgi:hypothetical protein
LHYRLLIAASLKEYKPMLECFHPSSRLTEPHVFCQYLGTDGLSDKHEGEGSLYADCQTAERLGRLTALYSRFWPDPDTEEKYVIPNRRPRVGAIIGPDGTVLGEGGPEVDKENYIPKHEPIGGFVKRTINIESFEDFSQLCVIVSLVKVVPTSALLLSANTVNDGIVRVWRDWLGRHSNVVKRNVGDVLHGPITSPDRDDDDAILWIDGVKNVGLKLKVRERRWNRDVPVLQHRDEEMVVSYELYIEGRNCFFLSCFLVPFLFHFLCASYYFSCTSHL